MKNDLIIFTSIQGNLLIRILIAHFASDFILQNKYIIENKKWISKQMLIHVAIVFITTLILSKSILISTAITITHWLIDSIKIQLLNKQRNWESLLFFLDQIAHLITIIIIWAIYLNSTEKLLVNIQVLLLNNKNSLILLAYIFVVFPASYMIKYLSAKITQVQINDCENEISKSKEIIDGGKLIGQFERLIILTFVLLNQYEAIGFLITGKSIIRFAQKDENLRSEYVLAGTMISYAIAIITGVVINNLL